MTQFYALIWVLAVATAGFLWGPGVAIFCGLSLLILEPRTEPL